MNVFFDTSVLVAAIVEEHSSHERAVKVFQRVIDGTDEGSISSHSIAETYSTLTRLPGPLRHSPSQAFLSIEQNILNWFKTVSLTGGDYASVIRDAAAANIQGGTIHDAVLVKCAGKSGAKKIYTLNLKHFQAVAPHELVSLLSTP